MKGVPVTLYKISVRLPAAEAPQIIVDPIECRQSTSSTCSTVFSGIYRPGIGYIYPEDFGKLTETKKGNVTTLISWYRTEPTPDELNTIKQRVMDFIHARAIKQRDLLIKTQEAYHENLHRLKALKELNVHGQTTP